MRYNHTAYQKAACYNYTKWLYKMYTKACCWNNAGIILQTL